MYLSSPNPLFHAKKKQKEIRNPELFYLQKKLEKRSQTMTKNGNVNKAMKTVRSFQFIFKVELLYIYGFAVC